MSDQDRRALEIFSRAVELDGAERDAFLADACRGDSALQDSVESLLEADHNAPTVLDSGAPFPVAPQEETPEDLPRQIGDYRLLEVLGEGGMGVVYLARQSEPIRRQVALKLLRPGMGSKEVAARFQAERQALAVMDHPSISQVFDAGVTSDDRPYFVMEYVTGIPITEYCDQHELTLDDRIRLFGQVCRAVQHAHLKGVIHRDLKPSNILVTEKGDEPLAKVIDFGIAKATGTSLVQETLHTQLGRVLGTPQYMSPEQFDPRGLDIDSRTDVYSLGTVLFRLLTGVLPVDVGSVAPHVMLGILYEKDVPRPSTRFEGLGEHRSVVAKDRKTEPDTLARELRGDLDWIVLKAMSKDRSRRYETADQLWRDLERYLHHQPVQARAPTISYVALRFVRRHRGAVIAASVALLALIGGVVGTTAGMLRAMEAEREAQQEAEVSQEVSDFLVGIFQVSDPSEARGNSITAREILDRGAERIQTELVDQPVVQGRLMNTMGRVYTSLGLYGDAAPLVEGGLDIRRASLEAGDPEIGASLADLAGLYRRLGRPADAVPLLSEHLGIAEGSEVVDTAQVGYLLQQYGMLLRDLGRLDTAEVVLDRAIEYREASFGPEHPYTGLALNAIGWLYHRDGRTDEALSTYRRALPIVEAGFGPEHEYTGFNLNDLGVVYSRMGQPDSAIAYYERTLEIREKIFAPDHPEVAAILQNLAIQWAELGDFEKAEEHYQRAIDIYEATFGEAHPRLVDAYSALGLLYHRWYRYGLARSHLERAVTMAELVYDPDHPGLAGPLNNLGYFLRSVGDTAAASRVLQHSLTVTEKASGPTHPRLLYPLTNLAYVRSAMRDFDGATRYRERILDIVESQPTRDTAQLAGHMAELARVHLDGGRPAEARTFFERGNELLRRAGQPLEPSYTIRAAMAHAAMGDLAVADSIAEAAIDAFVAAHGEGYGLADYHRAIYAAQLGDLDRALGLLESAMEKGFVDLAVVREEVFRPLHEWPRFVALVEEVNRRVEASTS